MWCVPTLDDAYKRRMNDILETYERPYDAKFPVVCLDEKSVALHADIRAPLRGKITRRDFEYRRHGTANLFMMTQPKGGRHYVGVTKTRKKSDFASCLRWLASIYKTATTIHLVMDNLNTHKESSLTEKFGEVEGRRLWSRFTPHYTPKHGSWLNQAEIAISVMQKCCIGTARYSTPEQLRTVTTAFWKKRRRERWKIDWGFTIKKANAWIKTFKSKH